MDGGGGGGGGGYAGYQTLKGNTLHWWDFDI